MLGVAFVLVLSVVEVLFPTVPFLNLFGIALYPADIVVSMLGVAALVRACVSAEKSLERRLLFWILVVCVLSMALGINTYGLERVGNEARKYIYVLIAAFYLSGFEFTAQMQQWLTRSWLRIAGVLLMTALFLWLVLTMLGSLPSWLNVPEASLRVLPARSAFFMAQAWLLLLDRELRGDGTLPDRVFLYSLSFALVFLQHRTVWAVMLVALGLLLAGHRGVRHRFWLHLGVTALVSFGLALALFGSNFDRAEASLGFSLSEPFAETSTFRWRLEGWAYLLSPAYMTSLMEYAIGKPFGAGFDRLIRGQIVEVSPHSFYVETLLRLGAVGLLLFVFLYLRLWRGAAQSGFAEGVFSPHILRILLVMQAVYFVTYTPSFEQGILLGAIIASAQFQGRAAEIMVGG